MSFGTEWGWGIEINEARKMLDLYLDNGGNFVDTANFYTNGSSEKMLGEFLGEKRQQIVLSTKYTMNTHPGDPNGGGNHCKSMDRFGGLLQQAHVEHIVRHRLFDDHLAFGVDRAAVLVPTLKKSGCGQKLVDCDTIRKRWRRLNG
jgi:aryl-alcohol dehydrogenase-like predicted oxidoreductase